MDLLVGGEPGKNVSLFVRDASLLLQSCLLCFWFDCNAWTEIVRDLLTGSGLFHNPFSSWQVSQVDVVIG